MGDSCSCCRSCCYSTPYGSVFSLSLTLVGLVGFLSSSIYSLVLVNNTSFLSEHLTMLASIVGSVSVCSLIPLFSALIMGYCITGYVRDELYHPIIKGCVTGCCNMTVMVMCFFLFFIWVLVSVGLSLILTLYIELEWGCPKFQSSITLSSSFEECFDYEFTNNSALLFCKNSFDELCTQGRKIGLSLGISLAFSLVVIIGFVIIIVLQAANYVSARESSKRSYRPGGDY